VQKILILAVGEATASKPTLNNNCGERIKNIEGKETETVFFAKLFKS